MTVAANSILRDPLTVGQSLKTVSLRLNGTDLKTMEKEGEEIDGYIQTTSKLRQAIMDATRTKSNNMRGVDILDSKGNYLSTYQVLLKISQVFEEIGEADKKYSTNRQSFITETLGGKTRAAAVSSLLQNPEMLKEVYEASLNSEGSAQAELDKQLESVEGRTQRLINHLQELAAVNINSDWLKDTITFLDKIIQLVTTLTDKVGGLNIVVGGAVGAFLGLTKHGENRFRQPTTPTGGKSHNRYSILRRYTKDPVPQLAVAYFLEYQGKAFS